MDNEQARLDVRKAMAYDLLKILKGRENGAHTADEIEKIIKDYIEEQSK